MKRVRHFFLVSLALIMPVCCSAGVFDADKVFQFGARGGVNFTSTGSVSTILKNFSFNNYTGFHIGAAFRFNLPAGFSLQPEVLYRQTGSKMVTDQGVEHSLTQGSIFVPLELQWGPRFSIVRPYVSAHVAGNFPVLGKMDGSSEIQGCNIKDSFNKAAFCYGLGVGLEIWKFSVAWRYNWTTAQFSEGIPFFTMLKDATLSGFDLSLAFLF